MIRSRIAVPLTIVLLVVSSYSLKADVRADEKNHVELAGALGEIVNIFGGKAAREGTVSTVAVKGDRKVTTNDTTGQIIDLSEEKVYDLDMKRKTYKVTTFDELRRRMEEAQKRAEANAGKEQSKAAPEPSAAPDKNQKQMEIDFSLKETGEKKNVNGFETHEIVMTITMREKGKKIDESGGLILTSDMWMGPKITAMREVPRFDQRYWQQLHGVAIAGASPEDMAAASAMYPMMKDAVARMNSENVKMDGTPILTTTTMDAVKSADEMAQEQQQQASDANKPSQPSTPSGMIGGFLAKKMAQKKQAPSDQPPNRTTFMTTTSEVLKVTTDVGAGDVAIPAGFKESR